MSEQLTSFPETSVVLSTWSVARYFEIIYSTVSRHTPGHFPRNVGWEKVKYVACKHKTLKIDHSWESQVSRNFSVKSRTEIFLQRLHTASPGFEVILLTYVTTHSKLSYYHMLL